MENLIRFTVENKYTVVVNGSGDTINYVQISHGDQCATKENGSYTSNTDDPFIVRMVNTLHGLPMESERDIIYGVNTLLHMMRC